MKFWQLHFCHLSFIPGSRESQHLPQGARARVNSDISGPLTSGRRSISSCGHHLQALRSSQDHPHFSCTCTRCSHPWRIWREGAAELCAQGAATPAASPMEGLRLACKAGLSHRAPLPHTTSLQELLLHLQPLPPQVQQTP